MNKTANNTPVLCFLVLLLAACALRGCAPRAAPPEPTVPAAAPAGTGERMYVYEHTIDAGGRAGEAALPMHEEYIVAVGRVGDNKPVDTPFGKADAFEIEGKLETGGLDIGVSGELHGRAGSPPGKRGMSHRTRQRLISLLVEAGCFTVVERDEINEIVREIDFGESRYVSEERAAGIGNLYGVRYIITGAPDVATGAFENTGVGPDNWVSHVGFPEDRRADFPAVFRLRMYEVESGRIWAVGEGYAWDHDEALRNAVTALKRAVRRLERSRSGG